MSRKDTLRELLNPVTTTPVQTPGTVHPPKELTRSERTESGAVKAMGLTLQKLSAEAESARERMVGRCRPCKRDPLVM